MQQGLLVIAHGSRDPNWIQLVDQAVGRAQTAMPVVVCFLELVTGRLIQDGLRELENMGVEEILALPLFVSSGSTHIEEIAYLLGLVAEPQIDVEDEQPYEYQAQVKYLSPMDDHPLIAEILLERATLLSQNPSEEVLLLIGHGSEYAGFHEKWIETVHGLGKQICAELPFADFTYGFMHSDSLTKVAERYEGQRLIGLPLFLSEGYFTRQVIPHKLAGLHVEYDGQTYLPHSNVTKWLEAMTNVSSGM